MLERQRYPQRLSLDALKESIIVENHLPRLSCIYSNVRIELGVKSLPIITIIMSGSLLHSTAKMISQHAYGTLQSSTLFGMRVLATRAQQFHVIVLSPARHNAAEINYSSDLRSAEDHRAQIVNDRRSAEG